MTDDLLQRFDRETEAGLFPGLKGRKAPLLVDGQNLIFDEMSIQPLAGVQVLGTKLTSLPIRGVTETLLAGKRNVFFATDDKLFRYEEGSGITEVGSGYTGVGKLWALERWGNWIIASNGVDPVQIWKSTTFGPLAGTTFTSAEILIRNRTFMIAMNTSNGSEYVEWCKIDNVEDWARTNPTAGYLPIRDLPSPIMAAVPLGREIAFYSTNTMHLLSFLGTRYTYGHDQLLKGIGAVGKHSVCSGGAFNYGFGLEGIWRTDGTGFQYISSPAMRDYIFNDINTAQLHKIVSVHVPKRASVMFFYPSRNSQENDRGVVVNYNQQTWSKIGYGRTALVKEGILPNIVSGEVTGEISMIDVEGSVGGESGVPLLTSMQGTIDIGFGKAPFGVWTFSAPQEF